MPVRPAKTLALAAEVRFHTRVHPAKIFFSAQTSIGNTASELKTEFIAAGSDEQFTVR